MYLDSSEDENSSVHAIPPSPPPPGRYFPPLPRNGNVRVNNMAGTGSPPCDPWFNPSDASTRKQPRSVHSEPYKKAFVRNAEEGRGRTDGGHRDRNLRSMGGRSRGPRSVAQRRATSVSKLRHTPGPKGGRRETTDRTNDVPSTDVPQTNPAPVKVEARVPFPGVPRGTGTSMSFSGANFGSQPCCRLRI